MLKKLGMTLMAVLMIASLAACSVEQTEEGELPEVNVEGGNMPEYDVDTATIDASTETTTIAVPDIDITMPNESTTTDENPPPPQQ
jgi:hypothetical protein